MEFGHDHAHTPGGGRDARAGHAADQTRPLTIALTITTVILLVEVVGAALSGSLSLLADAGHMLTDAAGLLIAVIAARLARRPATDRRTWGYRRAEVLAATAQAAVLLAVGVFVLVEGVRRLFRPAEVAPSIMLVFGAVALVGNLVSLLVLTGGRGANLNVRAAFLEVAGDALGSVAVLTAGVVVAATGWARADAVASILIGLAILPRTVRLLAETVDVLLENAPRGLDLDEVRRHILQLPTVRAVHDLHASRIASDLPVLTAHVVVDDDVFGDGRVPPLLDRLQACVAEHFAISIEHSTFQLEPAAHRGHELVEDH